MDWFTTQDLCLLNMDNPTRTGPSGQISLIDFTVLSPEIYILKVLLLTNSHWPYPPPIKLSRICVPIPFRIHLPGVTILLAPIAPSWTKHVDVFWSSGKFLCHTRTLYSRKDWLKYKHYAAKLRRYIKFAARRFWDSLCTDCSNHNKVYKLLHWLASRDALSEDNVIKNPTPLVAIHDQAQAFIHFYSREDCA